MRPIVAPYLVDFGTEEQKRKYLPRLARGDVAVQVRDHALRQVVGLDLVGHGQCLQLGHQAPVAADHPPHHALVAEVIESAIAAVALPRGVDQREVARMAQALRIALAAGQKQITVYGPFPEMAEELLAPHRGFWKVARP